MATDLASIRARVGVELGDAGGVNYPQAQLDEGIRLALNEYNLMLGFQGVTAVTLSGLDGAVATTLPAIHEGALVVGAAGYAVSGRAVDRSEAFDLNQQLPQQLVDLGRQYLNDFRKMVGQYRADLTRDAEMTRKSGFTNAAPPPYPSTDPAISSWPVDARDGEKF
ncbi:MAG TPA: hypothetical protein VMT46_19400 [Anaerolineaceae bacterium]|nr:hypothetical protein [Anaerolineaceae bacterium]